MYLRLFLRNDKAMQINRIDFQLLKRIKQMKYLYYSKNKFHDVEF